MEDSEERFENLEAKKPSVPDLGPQILVEISRGLLDQPTASANHIPGIYSQKLGI